MRKEGPAMEKKLHMRRWLTVLTVVLLAGSLILGTLYAQGFWD